MMTRLLGACGLPKNGLGRGLVREIILVLLVKLTVISLAAVFIFGPNQRSRVDVAKVAAHLIGGPTYALPLQTAASNSIASRSKIP